MESGRPAPQGDVILRVCAPLSFLFFVFLNRWKIVRMNAILFIWFSKAITVNYPRLFAYITLRRVFRIDVMMQPLIFRFFPFFRGMRKYQILICTTGLPVNVGRMTHAGFIAVLPLPHMYTVPLCPLLFARFFSLPSDRRFPGGLFVLSEGHILFSAFHVAGLDAVKHGCYLRAGLVLLVRLSRHDTDLVQHSFALHVHCIDVIYKRKSYKFCPFFVPRG